MVDHIHFLFETLGVFFWFYIILMGWIVVSGIAAMIVGITTREAFAFCIGVLPFGFAIYMTFSSHAFTLLGVLL
jgi:hypothetical protein